MRLIPLPVMARWCSVTLASGQQSEVRRLAELPAWARQRVLIARRVIRRWPIDGTCLRQSLVVGQRLRKLEPTLHIGLRSGEAGVQAHAWIEVMGGALDPTIHQYDELRLSTELRGRDRSDVSPDGPTS